MIYVERATVIFFLNGGSAYEVEVEVPIGVNMVIFI